MAALYKVITYSPLWVKLHELWSFTYLGYNKQVGREGLAKFGIPHDHPCIDDLEENSGVEVWRCNPAQGVDWYCDFRGFYKDFGQEQNPYQTFEAVVIGEKYLLSARTVAWKAETANRSQFTAAKAETIGKTLASYNAGANATIANGRIADGTWTGAGLTITIQADGAAGNTLSWYCAGDNLLETLYNLSLVGGGDFDLIKTGTTTWDFRWYLGQRGTDRSATVLFATEYGNLAAPSYARITSKEKTVAITGGQGKGANREWVSRTGPNYSAAKKVETTVDARHVDTTAALNAEGDSAMDNLQAQTIYGFRAVQTQATAYGVHYCVDGALGDLVKARYHGVESTQKVDEVTVSFVPGEDEVIVPLLKEV